ncbi:DUF1345 domain-containing protein [Schumannella luteola]|nr:DUF1345 domain-containing protein [Schumannella luteola]
MFVPWLRWVVVVACLAVLTTLVFLNPHRLSKESRWSRVASIVLAVLLLVANQFALVALIIDLLSSGDSDAGGILLMALQVWVTNVIAYAVMFWEIDRGGPVVRRRDAREKLPHASFRFPQDEDHDTVAEVAAGSSKTADWTPEFFDYLYFSASNSMAFSATDAMPLTRTAKALMLLESFSAFVILALVIARAVSAIG